MISNRPCALTRVPSVVEGVQAVPMCPVALQVRDVACVGFWVVYVRVDVAGAVGSDVCVCVCVCVAAEGAADEGCTWAVDLWLYCVLCVGLLLLALCVRVRVRVRVCTCACERMRVCAHVCV